MSPTTEADFESVIKAHLLANGYVVVINNGFDRERAIFPQTALGFIREDSAGRVGEARSAAWRADGRAGGCSVSLSGWMRAWQDALPAAGHCWG